MANNVNTTPVSKCANVQCSNMVNEGSFDLVTVGFGQAIVGGHRGMTLLLCSPCAKALKNWSFQLTAIEDFMSADFAQIPESNMSPEEDAARSTPKEGETWLFRKEFKTGLSFKIGIIRHFPNTGSETPEHAEDDGGTMFKFNSILDYLPVQKLS